MHVDPNSPKAELTKRQQEILERLERGDQVKQIATDIGVSRNAVYQHIERLRRQGAVAETYTPSGQPPRRAELAAGDAGGTAYAEAIEGAIAAGDAVGLAYELGRLDVLGEHGLSGQLIESALRRLSVLPSDDQARE